MLHKKQVMEVVKSILVGLIVLSIIIILTLMVLSNITNIFSKCVNAPPNTTIHFNNVDYVCSELLIINSTTG